MSQSTVSKSVGGVTKITTMTRTITSSTQHQLQQQQQQQTNQKVTTKPSNTGENGKKDNVSLVPRTEGICVRCNRTVYKMEEVIAEQQIWHKNCFKCNECDKTLNRHSKVDSFQIRDGVVYCKPHFKQLFGMPDVPTRRPELVISENQPSELPDSVVRSSKQHDLGLENIETAAVKRRFRMFEKIGAMKDQRSGDYGHDDDESIHSEDYDDDVDVDLIRAKRAQRERPSNFEAMNEIKSKFEAGMEQSRQARYEERKQEIQSIRSKLFTGKLTRTTEMYQKSLLETTSNQQRNKGSTLAHDLSHVKSSAKNAQKVKQQFETGDVYRKSNTANNSDAEEVVTKDKPNTCGQISNKVSERMQMLAKQQAQDKVIKSHAKVKVAEKADIQNQFEFFENYNPEEHNRDEFKITSTTDATTDRDGVVEKAKSNYIDRIKKSKTIEKQEGIRREVSGSTQDQLIRGENDRSNDQTEYESSEISSRRPGYLDTDLEKARLAARTKDLKTLYERWNYENNVYDTTEYNDSIPEYEEIDESQTETTKTIRSKFENLPNTGRIQKAQCPRTNRFVD